MVLFCTFGMVQSFGVFQDYYTVSLATLNFGLMHNMFSNLFYFARRGYPLPTVLPQRSVG